MLLDIASAIASPRHAGRSDLIHIVAGFAAGLVHVLSGPDHLAAVTPLAASGRRKSWLAGMLWGTGHTGGVWLVAIAALLLRGVLPLDRISSWSERLVGVVLIGIGLWGLQQALRRRAHVHEHEHDGERHAHLHLHRHPHEVAAAAEPVQPRPATPTPAPAHAHTHAALGVGVLHGLAGSSHFLGVLPALALPTHAGAAAYILGFGIGTVAAMTLYATCVGALAQRTARRAAGAYRILLASCAGAAIVVGCFWLASSH